MTFLSIFNYCNVVMFYSRVRILKSMPGKSQKICAGLECLIAVSYCVKHCSGDRRIHINNKSIRYGGCVQTDIVIGCDGEEILCSMSQDQCPARQAEEAVIVCGLCANPVFTLTTGITYSLEVALSSVQYAFVSVANTVFQ